MNIPDEAVEAAIEALLGSKLGDHAGINGEEFVEAAHLALEAAAPHLMAPLVECLFRGYQTLGFDTDGDRSGAEMLSRQGLGGRDLDGFIRVMDDAFKEARADYDEACGIEPEKPNA